ncbi:MAG: luciferase [Glaciihabitans sp.]|nr:luciferase [Glaciihabitans sp.]
MSFELGIYHFGELTANPHTGTTASPAQRIKELIEQAEVADQAGLSVFAVGEHHRRDFVVSAPPVVLAAMAARTSQIKLSSSATVISSDDPVRIAEQFNTLDLISEGRAEIIAGRGSYTESFPLFGYDLAEYGELFNEKLELLMKIQEEDPITWSGSLRTPLKNAEIAPRPFNGPVPIWVGVGGTPASAIRAARLGLPMALGILGGPIDGFAPLIDSYREAGAAFNTNPDSLAVSVNTPGFVARNSQLARDISYPYFAAGMMENFHQRGQGFQMPRRAYDASASAAGALFVGSPQEIIDKVLRQHEAYKHQRILVQLAYGNVPQKETLTAIELMGTEILPAVRRELDGRAAA